MTKPVRFSWVPLHEAARPEGYRVVIELPAKGRIRIEPENGNPVNLRLNLACCAVRAGGPVAETIEECSEKEIMAIPRPIRPDRS